MKFSGKMCLEIILKVTKNQGFTLSLGDIFFEKPQWGKGFKSDPPPPAVLGLILNDLVVALLLLVQNVTIGDINSVNNCKKMQHFFLKEG